MIEKNARVIAFYLPQFHPTEVNDKYWGKGFTEWTNVAKAKPLFKGHYQPQIPSDLGFYDLRLPEIREEQAKMAEECGVEGFCYWHYWFGNGKRVLERPFNEVLQTGKPDYPFCLGWANHSWSNKTWQKTGHFKQDTVFLEQTYPGDEDYIAHFYEVLKAFKDPRYIRVDGKPLFLVFNPDDIPDNTHFIELWRKLARENGLDGIHFVARADAVGKFEINGKFDFTEHVSERYQSYLEMGYDAINSTTFRLAEIKSEGTFRVLIRNVMRHLIGGISGERYDYKKIMQNFYTEEDRQENVYPQLCPRFDKTPRMGKEARMYTHSTPEAFQDSVHSALEIIKSKEEQHKILFLQAWNEWGEGMYMEPDIKFQHGYLDALKEEIVRHE